MEKVHVRVLNELGHETFELTPEEAEELIMGKEGRFFVVDEETRKLIREVSVSLEPGQRIALIPIAKGG